MVLGTTALVDNCNHENRVSIIYIQLKVNKIKMF